MATRSPGSRGISRSEIKRRMVMERQRLDALGEAAPALPEALETILGDFVPRRVDLDRWDAGMGDFVLDVMRRGHIRGMKSFRQVLSEVTMFVDWAVGAGHDMTLEALLRHDLTEQWITTQNVGEADSTWTNRRSRLRNLASRIAPSEAAPGRAAVIGRAAVKAPYTLREVAAIIRLAGNQPSHIKRRQLSLLVAVGLGVGASPHDLRTLCPRNCHLGADGVWSVDLSQPERRVCLVPEYADLLVVGMTGVKKDQLFIGNDPGRKSPVSWVIDGSAISDEHPDVSQARLRSTWLLRKICEPFPLAAVLGDAGLTSGRTLTDLLPYSTDADYVAHLGHVSPVAGGGVHVVA
jgi:hypothetical protein